MLLWENNDWFISEQKTIAKVRAIYHLSKQEEKAILLMTAT